MGIHKASNTVYLIDFGLAKRYINQKSKEHIQYCGNKRMVGTLRYCSLNSQMGYEQSRRDDLESLGYCLVYMLKGYLPWQGIRDVNKREKHERIFDKKVDTSIGELCNQLPIEVARYMYYCRDLKFEEDPNYDKLKEMFAGVLERTHCFGKTEFDWKALRCDLTKRTRRNSNDSNKAECEDANASKPTDRKMSRKIEINNLVSGLSHRSVTHAKKEAKGQPNPFFDEIHEEQKLPSRAPDYSPVEEAALKAQLSKRRSGDSDKNLPRVERKNSQELPAAYRKKDVDLLSCDFRALDITERNNAYGNFAISPYG